jgi:hypothetical protein
MATAAKPPTAAGITAPPSRAAHRSEAQDVAD